MGALEASAIALAVVLANGTAYAIALLYFKDKEAQRKEAAIERGGLPVAVFSQLEDFRKRLAVIESQALSKMR